MDQQSNLRTAYELGAEDSEECEACKEKDARITELERENEQLVAFRRDVVSTKLFTYVKRWEVGDG